MRYTIFLDDLRSIGDVPLFVDQNEHVVEDFVHCWDIEEAIQLITEKGCLPYFISFDNDMGMDDNGKVKREGRDLVRWIVDQLLDGTYDLPEDFGFYVHSANPIAANYINGTMNGIIKHIRER